MSYKYFMFLDYMQDTSLFALLFVCLGFFFWGGGVFIKSSFVSRKLYFLCTSDLFFLQANSGIVRTLCIGYISDGGT